MSEVDELRALVAQLRQENMILRAEKTQIVQSLDVLHTYYLQGKGKK